jgi:hypothetical protein
MRTAAVLVGRFIKDPKRFSPRLHAHPGQQCNVAGHSSSRIETPKKLSCTSGFVSGLQAEERVGRWGVGTGVRHGAGILADPALQPHAVALAQFHSSPPPCTPSIALLPRVESRPPLRGIRPQLALDGVSPLHTPALNIHNIQKSTPYPVPTFTISKASHILPGERTRTSACLACRVTT